MRFVRLHNDPLRHVHERGDRDDWRLAWTRCGIRFAWGSVPKGLPLAQRCPGCAA